MGRLHTNLHNVGAQLRFLDGHACQFKNTDYGNFVEQKGRTNHPGIVWVPDSIP